MFAAGVQREVPFGFIVDVTYVGRRGLYLQRERNINQLPPGTHPGEPGRQHRGAASLQGLRRDPHLGELGRLEVQQPADQRRSPLQQGPEGRLRLHPRQVDGQRQRQAQRAVEHLRRHQLLGQLELRSPSRVQLLLHLRPAVLPRQATSMMGKLLGGWQISGATFFRTGTPFSITAHQRHRRRRRRQQRPAGTTWSATSTPTPTSSSRRRTSRPELLVQPDGVRRPGGRDVRQRAAQPDLRPRPAAVGHRAVQELRAGRIEEGPVPRRDVQLHQPRRT